MLRISLRGIKENIYPYFIPGWRPSSTTTLVFKNMPYVFKRGLLNRNCNNYFFLKVYKLLKSFAKKAFDSTIFFPINWLFFGTFGKDSSECVKNRYKKHTFHTSEWVTLNFCLKKNLIGRKWKKQLIHISLIKKYRISKKIGWEAHELFLKEKISCFFQILEKN